ncbi:DNA polymerase III subunit chi [Pyruvatibacter sp.]|uniref:DNA polymerase III subunit chi n=1 Tax=Pyruvatibacter sp. TaxID=1981328 RepID=UPI0032EF3988
MAELLFYHLERSSLEKVLPQLLEKTLERGWKAVVRTGSSERAQSLDAHLWTYSDDAFLPHGLSGGGNDADQPVLLTTGEDNPAAANVLFAVDGADIAGAQTYQRCVLMFDGGDAEAVNAARGHWKAGKEAGHDTTYWQQSAAGKWEKKA